MGNNIPQLDTIHFFKFYNLHKLDWIFENSNASIDHNEPIIKQLSADFEKTFGLRRGITEKAFDVDYIHTQRSSEGILLLYTHKDDEQVYRYFTNANTETYKVLTSF